MGIFYSHSATAESTIESELATIMQVVTESHTDEDEGIPYYVRFRRLFVDSFFTMLMSVIDYIKKSLQRGIDYIVRKFKIGKRGQELAAQKEAKEAAKEQSEKVVKEFENSPDFTVEPVRISLIDIGAFTDTVVSYLQKTTDYIVATASALGGIESDTGNLTSALNSLREYVNELAHSLGSNFEHLSDFQFAARSFVPVPFPEKARNVFAAKLKTVSQENSLELAAIGQLLKEFSRLREKLSHAQKALNTNRERFKRHPELLEKSSVTKEDLEHAHKVFIDVSVLFDSKTHANISDFLTSTSDKNRDIIKDRFELIFRQEAYFKHKKLLGRK